MLTFRTNEFARGAEFENLGLKPLPHSKTKLAPNHGSQVVREVGQMFQDKREIPVVVGILRARRGEGRKDIEWCEEAKRAQCEGNHGWDRCREKRVDVEYGPIASQRDDEVDLLAQGHIFKEVGK